MDLRERTEDAGSRHPWERSRLKALRSILDRIPVAKRGYRVLDAGCGDGFVARQMARDPRVRDITAVDIHLSPEEIAHPGFAGVGVTFRNAYDGLSGGDFDLALLLDVLEHVDQDGEYLADIVQKYVADGGYCVITVPAFPFLFGSHDRFLKHYRRYTRKDLLRLTRSAGLECISSGYLFFSLLIVRFVSSFLDKWNLPGAAGDSGVGSWKHGTIVTKTVEYLLDADVLLGMILSRAGFTLPGLTVWAVCAKPR